MCSSLGVVLYKLATGRHPFEAESLYGVLHAIVSQEPVPPSRLNPKLRERVEHPDPENARQAREPAAERARYDRRDRATGTGRRVARLFVSAQRAGASIRWVTSRPALNPALAVKSTSGKGGDCWSAYGLGIGKSTLVDDFLQTLDSSHPRGARRASERLAGTETFTTVRCSTPWRIRWMRERWRGFMKAVARL